MKRPDKSKKSTMRVISSKVEITTPTSKKSMTMKQYYSLVEANSAKILEFALGLDKSIFRLKMSVMEVVKALEVIRRKEEERV